MTARLDHRYKLLRLDHRYKLLRLDHRYKLVDVTLRSQRTLRSLLIVQMTSLSSITFASWDGGELLASK